jgi:hypothetical protein
MDRAPGIGFLAAVIRNTDGYDCSDACRAGDHSALSLFEMLSEQSLAAARSTECFRVAL